MISSEQREERKNGVGASDSPIIAGYSSYMSSYELYLMKRGEVVPEDAGDFAMVGNIIEDAIAKIYSTQRTVQTRKSNQTIYHPDHDFIFCHLDRTIPEGWGYPPGTPLEIKNTSQSKEWGVEEDGPEGVPIAHNIQVQHQMACTGKDVAVIAVLLWGNTLKVYNIPRDNELIDMIMHLNVKFWECVTTGTPPEISYEHSTILDLLRKLYPGTNGKRFDLPGSIESWHNVLMEARSHRKRYQAIIDNSKAHIIQEMGEYAVGMLPDGTGYTRSENKNGVIRLSHTKKPPKV